MSIVEGGVIGVPTDVPVVGDVAADIGEAVGRTAAGGELGQELLGAAFTSNSCYSIIEV